MVREITGTNYQIRSCDLPHTKGHFQVDSVPLLFAIIRQREQWSGAQSHPAKSEIRPNGPQTIIRNPSRHDQRYKQRRPGVSLAVLSARHLHCARRPSKPTWRFQRNPGDVADKKMLVKTDRRVGMQDSHQTKVELA